MRNIFPAVIFTMSLALIGLAAEPDSLRKEDKDAGWTLLFDGKSTNAWQGIGKSEFPSKGWLIQDGLLVHQAHGGGGDIVTVAQFNDFELIWQWRIAPGGNSGLKYNLLAPDKGVGCEYQLLDDTRHPDAALHGKTRRTGGLYDVLAPADGSKLNPPGNWNESRVIVRGSHVEHWLNGSKTVEFEYGSDALRAAIAESKFKGMPAWGEKRTSPILLQDHGDEIAFRSIKIRASPPK